MSRFLASVGLLATAMFGLALENGKSVSGSHARSRAILRRPVACVLADGGNLLFVANQRTGSVSVIDTVKLRVINEMQVGRKISDLAITANEKEIFVLAEEPGELIAFRRQGTRLEPRYRVTVAPYPVTVRLLNDERIAAVASLWSRLLTLVQLPKDDDSETKPRVLKTIDLDFAPRMQVVLPKPRKLVVADSFGGKLAVVDLIKGEVLSQRSLPAHNIRDLALSSDGLSMFVSHQVLNGQGTTSRDDIHWGNLITNSVREMRLTTLLDPKADLLTGSRVHRLGNVGSGSGDPGGMAIIPSGKLLVALSGVGEVAIGGAKDGSWDRVAVGVRPTRIALNPNGRDAYIVNTFGDTISVLDLKTNRVRSEVHLGPQAEQSKVDRGEVAFHNARLSHDGWFSCHSCHTDGHSNGLLADTLGDNSYGTPKRTLSLLGVKDTGPWAWNGSMRDLHAQVRHSIETTMRGNKVTAEHVDELVAFLESLSPPPARDRLRVDKGAVDRGRKVFEQQSCAICHVPPVYTSPKTFSLRSENPLKGQPLNPPSLRGLSQGGPYFHDGSAAKLEGVFTRDHHRLTALPQKDLDDLISYLQSL